MSDLLDSKIAAGLKKLAKERAEENAMLGYMVSNGVAFFKAEKLLKSFLEESGLRDIPKLREELTKVLKGKNFSDWDQFESFRNETLPNFWGLTEKDFTEACQKAKVVIPVKIRVASSGLRDRHQVLADLLWNEPDMSKGKALEILSEKYGLSIAKKVIGNCWNQFQEGIKIGKASLSSVSEKTA